MSAALKLPAKLDLSAAMKLVGDLREMQGDVNVDASEVTHMGALCVQALIASARKAKAEGHAFVISDLQPKAIDQMKVMGITPEQMMEGVQ